MKILQYRLFPIYIIVAGYLLILVSVYGFITQIDYTDMEEAASSIVGYTGILLFGLLVVTFRAYFVVDKESQTIIKQYKVFSWSLSRDEIRIPKQCESVLIREKLKNGRGYVHGVIGFSYKIKSYDIYFNTGGRLVKIMSTDYNRSLEIAELVKAELQLDYSFEKMPQK